MQILWTKIRIALQHPPVAMAGDESDLFDREARFAESTGRLVTQIVEMQILNFQLFARAPKSGTHGLSSDGYGSISL